MGEPTKASSVKREFRDVQVNSKKIAFCLELIVILLALVSLAGQALKYLTNYDEAFGLIPLMNIGLFLSVPTMYAIMLMALCGLLLVAISITKHNAKDIFRWHWTVLAVWFLHISFNLAALAHKAMTKPLRHFVRDNLPGLPVTTWFVSGCLIIPVLLIFYIKFFRNLPAQTKKMILITLAIYLSGFVCIDLIGVNYAETISKDDLNYNIILTIGKFLKMTSMVSFLYLLLAYLKNGISSIAFEF